MSMEGHKRQKNDFIMNLPQVILNKNTHIILAIFVGFLLGIVSIVVLARANIIDLSAKQYAYVEVERVIHEVNNGLLELIKANKIKDEEVENRLIKAKVKFDKLLKRYAKDHNTIVFSANKVIAGAKDVTEYFISNLKEIE